MSDQKIFDDFITVECEQCERWWLNQCDGCRDSVNGSKTPCNSFLATRNVTIPQEIDELKDTVMLLRVALSILGVVVVGILVALLEVV